MADEVKIDKELFHNRLNQLIAAWKNDKRSSNDAIFGGVGSIVILLGKNEEAPSYQKSNALHVRKLSAPWERNRLMHLSHGC